MAVTLPAIIKDYVAYLDSVGYAGKVPEAKLPVIKIKTAGYNAGGLAAEVEIDQGSIEKMDIEITFSEHIPAIMGMLGRQDAPITLRGAQEGEINTAEAVIISVRGLFSEVDPGSLKKGGDTQVKIKATGLTYYKYSIGATTVFEIDALNNKRVVNGVDQMAAIRRATGVGM